MLYDRKFLLIALASLILLETVEAYAILSPIEKALGYDDSFHDSDYDYDLPVQPFEEERLKRENLLQSNSSGLENFDSKDPDISPDNSTQDPIVTEPCDKKIIPKDRCDEKQFAKHKILKVKDEPHLDANDQDIKDFVEQKRPPSEIEYSRPEGLETSQPLFNKMKYKMKKRVIGTNRNEPAKEYLITTNRVDSGEGSKNIRVDTEKAASIKYFFPGKNMQNQFNEITERSRKSSALADKSEIGKYKENQMSFGLGTNEITHAGQLAQDNMKNTLKQEADNDFKASKVQYKNDQGMGDVKAKDYVYDEWGGVNVSNMAAPMERNERPSVDQFLGEEKEMKPSYLKESVQDRKSEWEKQHQDQEVEEEFENPSAFQTKKGEFKKYLFVTNDNTDTPRIAKTNDKPVETQSIDSKLNYVSSVKPEQKVFHLTSVIDKNRAGKKTSLKGKEIHDSSVSSHHVSVKIPASYDKEKGKLKLNLNDHLDVGSHSIGDKNVFQTEWYETTIGSPKYMMKLNDISDVDIQKQPTGRYTKQGEVNKNVDSADDWSQGVTHMFTDQAMQTPLNEIVIKLHGGDSRVKVPQSPKPYTVRQSVDYESQKLFQNRDDKIQVQRPIAEGITRNYSSPGMIESTINRGSELNPGKNTDFRYLSPTASSGFKEVVTMDNYSKERHRIDGDSHVRPSKKDDTFKTTTEIVERLNSDVSRVKFSNVSPSVKVPVSLNTKKDEPNRFRQSSTARPEVFNEFKDDIYEFGKKSISLQDSRGHSVKSPQKVEFPANASTDSEEVDTSLRSVHSEIIPQSDQTESAFEKKSTMLHELSTNSAVNLKENLDQKEVELRRAHRPVDQKKAGMLSVNSVVHKGLVNFEKSNLSLEQNKFRDDKRGLLSEYGIGNKNISVMAMILPHIVPEMIDMAGKMDGVIHLEKQNFNSQESIHSPIMYDMKSDKRPNVENISVVAMVVPRPLTEQAKAGEVKSFNEKECSEQEGNFSVNLLSRLKQCDKEMSNVKTLRKPIMGNDGSFYFIAKVNAHSLKTHSNEDQTNSSFRPTLGETYLSDVNKYEIGDLEKMAEDMGNVGEKKELSQQANVVKGLNKFHMEPNQMNIKEEHDMFDVFNRQPDIYIQALPNQDFVKYVDNVGKESKKNSDVSCLLKKRRHVFVRDVPLSCEQQKTLESLKKLQDQLKCIEDGLHCLTSTEDSVNNMALQIKVCVDVVNTTSPPCCRSSTDCFSHHKQR